jgi:acyl-CoA reductase-like NAD-dependent aldehyde dehydrogenase
MGHGDGLAVARPRAAEWARTAVHRSGYLLATTPGGASVWTPLHAVDPTGSVVLVVPVTDPLVAAAGKAAPARAAGPDRG